MPIVRVELCPGRTQEQKTHYVNEVTRLTAEILNCTPESIDVIFTKIPANDWARAGRSFSTPAE
jgi:4-oxalocrotonate tautomerase